MRSISDSQDLRACQLFTKNKERIQIFKAKGGSRYIYKNELDMGITNEPFQ